MNAHDPSSLRQFIGVGLYTPAEAGRLIGVTPSRLARWLRGHGSGSRRSDALWTSQIHVADGGLFLGFRDLMEARVASSFIDQGLSPQRVRQAILSARDLTGQDHPLSSMSFRTDGRDVFLQVVEADGQTKLVDLFRRQYAFRDIIERSLRNVDYSAEGSPRSWWPLGRDKSIVLDPARSFGQPIESVTAIPTIVLWSAAKAEGSAEAAARIWSVPVRAVKQAIIFQDMIGLRQAA